MYRVVVLCLAVCACDRGPPRHREPPSPRDAPAAPADATAPIDAIVVDAEVVDALVLAPPKAAAQQKRDCAKVAELVGNLLEEKKDVEMAERIAAIRKACIVAPWSATILDCALNAKGDENPYDCPHLMLPPDQSKAWHKAMKDVFCKYNDCIPDGFQPGRPPASSDDEIDKLLNGN
jgi:hypothetical protein